MKNSKLALLVVYTFSAGVFVADGSVVGIIFGVIFLSYALAKASTKW